MFGSAPCSSSRRMTSTSPAAAARKNGVWPVRSTHDTEPTTTRMKRRSCGNSRVRAFGSAPVFEQPLDQRERLVAHAAVVAVAAELEVAHVDGRPERRLAVPVHRRSTFAPASSKQLRDLQMIARARAVHAKDARVDDRIEQRRDAVAVGELEARAVARSAAARRRDGLRASRTGAASSSRRRESACRGRRASPRG